ncbi:MAG: hypothetical protein II625_10545 [Bacilli bacterium]|nr:hypothetical protein [Bacilli bacterium]
MEEFGKTRWFIKDNEISASLMHWYVSIDLSMNNRCIPLEIYSDGQKLLRLSFKTLEEAISFTNNVLNKAWDVQEIKNSYQELYGIVVEDEEEKISERNLTPIEVDQALLKYFGEGKSYRISLIENIVNLDGNLDMEFYLVEHIDNNGNKETNHIRLTRGDLKNALNAYVELDGFELVDFVYIGGIHHVGYFIDEDTPHYDGIHLSIKKKKNKGLELKRKDINEYRY